MLVLRYDCLNTTITKSGIFVVVLLASLDGCVDFILICYKKKQHALNCVFYWKMNVIKRDMMVPGDELICELPKIYAIHLTTPTKCATAWQCSRGFLPYLQKNYSPSGKLVKGSISLKWSHNDYGECNHHFHQTPFAWNISFLPNWRYFFDQYNIASCTKWLERFFISIKHSLTLMVFNHRTRMISECFCKLGLNALVLFNLWSKNS